MSVKVHEPVCEDSAQDLYFWFDHFLGDQVKDEWNAAGTGTAVVVDAQTGGIARITTGATDNDFYELSWNNIRSLLVSKKVTFEARVKFNNVDYNSCTLGLFNAWNEFAYFFTYEDAGATGSVEARSAVAAGTEGGGVAIDVQDLLYHIYRIECHTHGANHIHYYIDNVLEATHTTRITATYLQPRFRCQTLEDATKSMDVDYVVVRQER